MDIDPRLMLVVAREAKRLPVRLIPEKLLIAAMGRDVVYHASSLYSTTSRTHPAERVVAQILTPNPIPP
jgi:hypothetical protein